MGLIPMIEDVIKRVRAARKPRYEFGPLNARDHRRIATSITVLEGADGEGEAAQESNQIRRALARVKHQAPVVGITGTGGAGKSSLSDELLSRFVRHFPDRQIAVVAIDPTRRRSGGALLGDRIRMNSLANEQIFMRSLATRRQHLATSAVLKDVIELYQLAGFDLIFVETAGIGQSDTEIVDVVDLSLYVMTSDYGAASQLEKIDMLDFADMVVLNKFEKRGAEDSLRHVRKQWRRNHPERMQIPDNDVPVFPTIASRFNDPGVNRLFASMCAELDKKSIGTAQWAVSDPGVTVMTSRDPLIPGSRSRYLAEIAESGREARAGIEQQIAAARRAYAHYESLKALKDAALPAPLDRYPEVGACRIGSRSDAPRAARRVSRRARRNGRRRDRRAEGLAASASRPSRRRSISYKVRGRDVTGDNYTTSLSGSQIPKIAVPRAVDWGEILAFVLNENLPGAYPYTAACIRIGARRKIRRACSRARARRSAPTAASTISPAVTLRRGCRPRSTPRRCTARIPTRGRTSTAAPATPACRSRRSTT